MRIEIDFDNDNRKGILKIWEGETLLDERSIKGFDWGASRGLVLGRDLEGNPKNLKYNGPVKFELSMIEDEDALD
jgi:hypothetical protein